METTESVEKPETKPRPRNGAGGTPGGVGQFFFGLLMAVAGGYLLMSHVTVTTGFWPQLFGLNAFGLTLIPLLIGIGMLFYNGRSPFGWILTVAGLTIIFAGIIMNLHIYFQPTSLFNTLIMLGLLAGGMGLIARSLKEQGV